MALCCAQGCHACVVIMCKRSRDGFVLFVLETGKRRAEEAPILRQHTTIRFSAADQEPCDRRREPAPLRSTQPLRHTETKPRKFIIQPRALFHYDIQLHLSLLENRSLSAINSK